MGPEILVRHHAVLAKVCLGGGFAYGFTYTANHGTSPIHDMGKAAGTRTTNHRMSAARARSRFPPIHNEHPKLPFTNCERVYFPFKC